MNVKKILPIGLLITMLSGCGEITAPIKDCLVEFVNYDYTTIQSMTLKSGETPFFVSDEPIKLDYEESYFTGWTINDKFYSKDETLPKIEDDTLIVATFEKGIERDWIDERDFDYVNKLTMPKDHVSNIFELSQIVDYYGFYKIEEFDVYLNDDYVFDTENKDLSHELNVLYWYVELINGKMGMNARLFDDNRLHFVLTFYHNNFMDNEFEKYIELKNIASADYSFTSSRTKDFNSFATENSSLPVCDVYSSEQLYYAVQNGYRPNCIIDSPAEKYYQSCKDLLIEIIDDTDSYYQKINKIYDYIETNSQYDYSIFDDEESSNPDLYPDYFAASSMGYYLESFFERGLCVCDAYSKLFSVLGMMEGIEIVRASGTADKGFESRCLPGHAYNYIKHDDGKWYYYDLTWGKNLVDIYHSTFCFNLHDCYSAPAGVVSSYSSLIDYQYDLSHEYDFMYYENHYVSYLDNKVDLYIDSNTEAENLAYILENVLTVSNTYAEILFDNSSFKKLTIDALKNSSNNQIVYSDCGDLMIFIYI